MDSKEKQIMVTASGLMLIFIGYAYYIYKTYIAANPAIVNDFRFWGIAFLAMIPVTIVFQIVIHIIFAIINKIMTNEDLETKPDERDKLITLKALRISHNIFTAGFMVSMVFLALGLPPYSMFIALIASGFISALVSEIAKIHFYRKGF